MVPSPKRVQFLDRQEIMLVRLKAKRIRSRVASPGNRSRPPDPPPGPMFGRKLANPR